MCLEWANVKKKSWKKFKVGKKSENMIGNFCRNNGEFESIFCISSKTKKPSKCEPLTEEEYNERKYDIFESCN
jgi:hypothetical protein